MTVTIQSRLKEPTLSSTCPYCRTDLEYLKSAVPSNNASFQISCARCARAFDAPSHSSSSKGKQAASSRRRIGTQASPLDTTYYDILEVPVDAELDAIKKSYRKLALKHHPDKLTASQRTPEAEEKFKQISIAYAVLSNPEERKKYNEYGPASKQQESGFVDPEQVFSSLFGGERFEDLIGKVSIGAEMKSALQKEEEQQEHDPASDKSKSLKAKKDMTPEEREIAKQEADKKKEKERIEAAERARVREERVKELHAKLIKKISIFTEQARSPVDEPVRKSVRAIWTIEAEELKDESHGVELLQSIGSTYLQRAQQYSAASGTPLGLGGWWSGMKQTATLFSDTYSTLRSAYELTDIFKELAAAEEKGLSEEKRKELEEKAAAKGMQALFKVRTELCDLSCSHSCRLIISLMSRAASSK